MGMVCDVAIKPCWAFVLMATKNFQRVDSTWSEWSSLAATRNVGTNPWEQQPAGKKVSLLTTMGESRVSFLVAKKKIAMYHKPNAGRDPGTLQQDMEASWDDLGKHPVYTEVCTNQYVCIYIYVYLYMIYQQSYKHKCNQVYIYIYLFTHAYLCIYMYIHIYLYINMYIPSETHRFIYIYTYDFVSVYAEVYGTTSDPSISVCNYLSIPIYVYIYRFLNPYTYTDPFQSTSIQSNPIYVV